jgi:F0F1-type ATP synthase assembly protein I
MAEDDTPNRVKDDEETPQIAVPSHSPLPPPPEIHYTRPTLGQKAVPRPSQTRITSGDPRPHDDASGASSSGMGWGAGLSFGSSIIAGAVIGSWIDKHWNHTGTPWATLIMTLLGTGVGFLNMYRLLVRPKRDRNQK